MRIAQFIAIAGVFGTARLGAQTAPFDIVIANGHVVDGTGSPW